MKKVLICLFFVFVGLAYAQTNSAGTVSIACINAQTFLKDAKNIVRYNPLNIFDNDSDSVYAINKKDFDKKNPLLQIYLGNSIYIDELHIKPGYFNKKYFKSNYRIKTGTVILYEFNNKKSKELVRKDFEFSDEMNVQTIMFSKSYKVSKVEIYVSEFYEFEKWDDIVVSDINFSYVGMQYENGYGDYTNCYKSYIENNKYNSEGLLVTQRKDYPPFWGYSYEYLYDSHNRLRMEWRDGGDGPGSYYKIYEYEDYKAQYPCEVMSFEKTENGNIKNYKNNVVISSYDEVENRITVNYSDETKTYVYNGNQLEKFVSKDNGVKRQAIFYYQDGNCIMEEYSGDVYIYKYENKKLKYKILVHKSFTDSKGIYEYCWDKDNLINVTGYTHRQIGDES